MRTCLSRRIVAASVLGMIAVCATAATQPPVTFTFSYPAQVQHYLGLQAWLKQDETKLRSTTTAAAKADQAQAAKDGREFHPYEATRTWKVVTDTPRFLSLSLDTYAYTGGAHGNSAFGSTVWDKTTNSRRTAASFFYPQALGKAVSTSFCRQLDAARRIKRNGEQASLADFNQCIDPLKQTLILGSSNHRQFNRIGFLIAPYEAGPYAEGTYEVTVPVTPAILAAVRRAWRSFFAVMSAASK
jgi:hypothetical protein